MSSIGYNYISLEDMFNKDSSEGYGSVLYSLTKDFNRSLRKNMNLPLSGDTNFSTSTTSILGCKFKQLKI